MSILSGFKSFKRHILTDDGYQLMSEWQQARDVEFTDGDNLEEKFSTLEDTKQDAATAITTGNIGQQSVNYATSAGSATTATTATKATQDGSGSVITSTYQKVSDKENVGMTFTSSTLFTAMGANYFARYGKIGILHLCISLSTSISSGSAICTFNRKVQAATNVAIFQTDGSGPYTVNITGEGTVVANSSMPAGNYLFNIPLLMQ